jgi:hypothetical protein
MSSEPSSNSNLGDALRFDPVRGLGSRRPDTSSAVGNHPTGHILH